MAKRVLIVDDGATNRAFIKTYLVVQGFEAEVAEDGAVGLAKAKTGQYDLVFSDIEMPNMDGLMFLRELKKLPGYSRVPVVILSTVTKAEVIEETRRLGAVYYMVKPFNQEKMGEALRIAGF